MKTYKLIISYQGTAYSGWQYQPHKISITGILQDSFFKLFGSSIKILASSRTDAGVHAIGQIARFTADVAITTSKMLYAWNNVLPDDIIIRTLEEVAPTFHPLRSISEKTYYYIIFTKKPLPFIAPFGWHIHRKIDLTVLQEALNIFVGTHDFRSFCTGDDKENTVRTITSIRLQRVRRFGCYQITCKGSGFLRHMVRRIVGACVLVAIGEKTVEQLRTALQEKSPQQQLFTAPAQGLILRKIIFKNS